MKGFKLTDLLGEQPPATTTSGGKWDIQHIPLEQIVPAKNNNYRICDIEPLADSIHADGLEAPLVVRTMPDGGQYELISGERRYTAIKLLRDRGLAGYDTAPCKVKDNVSDLAAEIELIRANSTARVLTDQEKVTQAARLSELLDELKNGGVKVPGRKREIIAGIMGVSSAQVGRMESVEKKLAPEAKAEFQQGNMNFSTAYETSLLPQEQQKKVVEDIQQGEKVDIKAVKQRRKPAPEDIPACPPHYCGTCIPGDCIHNQREEAAPPAQETEPQGDNKLFEIEWRELLISRLITAQTALKRDKAAEEKRRAEARESVTTYKDVEEAHDAFGWGYITEKQFDEIKALFENCESVSSTALKHIAFIIGNLRGEIKTMRGNDVQDEAIRRHAEKIKRGD